MTNATTRLPRRTASLMAIATLLALAAAIVLPSLAAAAPARPYRLVGDTLTARVLANYYDDRIADVGSLGLPDILEKGRLTFDFAAQYRVRRLTLRFSADNLTDEAIEYQQGGELQRRYTLGRTFALQFGFSAF